MKATKINGQRHKWANYATQCIFEWLTAQERHDGNPKGPEVWKMILDRMLSSDENWLHTFIEAFDGFLDDSWEPCVKVTLENNDDIGSLMERLITNSMCQVDRDNLAIGLLKHGGHWLTYARMMQREPKEIENDPDASVRATPRELAAMRAIQKELDEKDAESRKENRAVGMKLSDRELATEDAAGPA